MAAALIVMARLPVPGRVKTRLMDAIGAENAAALYKAFLADGLRQYATLGVPVRVYIEGCGDELGLPVDVHGASLHRQQGATLADRMESAFRETEAAGFTEIMIIGTDHPTLPTRFINEGFTALGSSSSLVIGPARDGGFYLLGMRPYHPDLLTGRSYSHANVLSETQERANQLGMCVTQLEAWYDIDTRDDLDQLVADLKHSSHAATETRKQLAAIPVCDFVDQSSADA